MHTQGYYDVAIIGAGLAGLSLGRQLLLNSDKTILLLDRRAEIPPTAQKVGEATVQVSGYYFSKVLDLEEHFLREHFMKYNLRFLYKTAKSDNRSYEDYSQSYIRTLSNIATYQLDRNKLEAELLRCNTESPHFTFWAPIADLRVALANDGPHTLTYTISGQETTVLADWVVDTSGRSKVLAHHLGLERPSPIRHGASFLWVEGLLNIEKLTDLSLREIRLHKDRAAVGHLPVWLATNHFVGEGFWFWVIPLQGKTSLGLVYDNTRIAHEQVATVPKLIDWVCEEFPLFARDLPYRKILHHSSFKDFAYGCTQTIHPSRWALSGESGRFTDPLYSSGGDFIALHNTLITDAILTTEASELAEKCQRYELMMQAFYESLLPSFTLSYDVLGDQETYVLKYTWELAVYFAFFVFPFINDLSTHRRFVMVYLAKFARLGAVNKNLQMFLNAYYHWKKTHRQPTDTPLFHDFTGAGWLRAAESTFYRVGISWEDAVRVLDEQLVNLMELARFIVAHVYAVVLADEHVLSNRAFIEHIDLQNLRFDVDAMRAWYAQCADATECYPWSFDPRVLDRFRSPNALA